jgi:hypothetical protein
MIAGHFGLAAAVKGREPQVPLWALMLATVWLDIVFVPLFLMGVETITVPEGEAAGYGHAIIHADYTHSVVGALALSAVFGWVAARRWGRRAGWILGAVSFSHWVLDLVVHRADMPWLPANWGDLPRLGLGLWRTPYLSATAEAALVLLGAWLTWRAARMLPARRGQGQLLALLILVGGLGTLLLDVTGVAG